MIVLVGNGAAQEISAFSGDERLACDLVQPVASNARSNGIQQRTRLAAGIAFCRRAGVWYVSLNRQTTKLAGHAAYFPSSMKIGFVRRGYSATGGAEAYL
ncbi:MAG: hypothetical protein ACREKL_00045, partial [Chthoniobacterales bacterium]